ncbi:MAG: CDP-glycerol glycerophosphotransferase family protein [Candidatus Neomarinimicrobiota bacterium]
MPPARTLLFATKPYSIAVLQPVQKAVLKVGGTVRWFLSGQAREFSAPGETLDTSTQVLDFKPEAVLAPGNVVPYQWPGLKVQIFHGLGEEKPGHYRITGFFDLYCTPGPHMTRHFEKLARRHGHFLVHETGWPKLDALAQPVERTAARQALGLDPERPVLLYAPTFSPRFTSATDLLPTIAGLQEPYQWLIKFHDLMAPAVKDAYQAQVGGQVVGPDQPDILPLMQAADLLITDTSSVAYEYLLLDRPIITYCSAVRREKGIDIDRPEELAPAIERSLGAPEEFAVRRREYLNDLHPWTDGRSAERVVTAVNEVLDTCAHLSLAPKPRNLWRKFQQRDLVS